MFGLDETLQPTLADMHDRLDDPAILRGVRDTGGRVVLAIYECMKPVIGAINGAAVGIGATMTLPMDIRLAAEGAKIGFVFGRLGIVPEACSSWFLPRLVGIPQALEWVYTAEPFDAAEGVRAGLLKAVVPADAVAGRSAQACARFIDNRSPVAVALARQLIYRNVAQSHPLEAHRVDSLAMWHLSQQRRRRRRARVPRQAHAAVHVEGVDRPAGLRRGVAEALITSRCSGVAVTAVQSRSPAPSPRS